MENTLLTEIMVLREKNAELVEALKLANNIIYGDNCSRGLLDCMDGYYTGVLNEELNLFESKIESLINSNITE